MFVPVERASADTVELGPDGYFSTLDEGDTPVASAGWGNTRKIVFGKEGSTGTYDNKTVSGGYKTLTKGAVTSVADADFGPGNQYTKSATTSVAANEALLFADDVVTAGFAFSTRAGTCNSKLPCNSFDASGYKSNLAQMSDAVGAANYSAFEQSLLRAASVEGVCTAGATKGCGDNYGQQKSSVNSYKVFPLSIGDVNKYFNHTSGWSADANLACPSDTCSHDASGFWLRSAYWYYSYFAFRVGGSGGPDYSYAHTVGPGLRPAVRLNLDSLLLSASHVDQSQNTDADEDTKTDDLRLTFVDKSIALKDHSASLSDRQINISGTHDLGKEYGWKLVSGSGEVVASGSSAEGTMSVPDSVPNGSYEFWYWGQQDGTAENGWSNKATVPERKTVKLPDYGPDGYYSKLEHGALPVASDGWADTRRIVFGKQGNTGTYNGASVSGGYKTLGYGGATGIASVPDALFHNQDLPQRRSATTAVAASEALLWADDVVTDGFAFDVNAGYRNTFDSAADSYKSNLAQVSDAVSSANYSVFEQIQLRAAKVEGVCTKEHPLNCYSGGYTQQSDSVNPYKVFPLSIGDIRQYLGHSTGYVSDGNLACPSNSCVNNASGYWLRTASWYYSGVAFLVKGDGAPGDTYANSSVHGLRPALRLNLEHLLLSADSGDQTQRSSGDLRLTFADASVGKLSQPSANMSGTKLNLSGTSSTANGFAADGFGWKLIDPDGTDGSVAASGFDADGADIELGLQVLPGTYDLYYWGQQNGTDALGQSNRATVPTLQQVTVPPIDQAPLDLNGLNEDYTYGDADFTVTATGGSGTGALTFTSSDPQVATIDADSGFVHITGTGSFTITVTKSADLHYNPASITSDAVTISARTLQTGDITFPSASDIVYGDALGDSTLSGGSSSYGTFAWQSPATEPSASENGSYPVTLTLNDNYRVDDLSILTRDVTVVVAKTGQSAPAVPVLASKGATTVLLALISGAEYRCDSEAWQDSPEFTDLQANRAYAFTVRLKGDANHEPSPASPVLNVTTDRNTLLGASVTIAGTYTYTGSPIVPDPAQVEVVSAGGATLTHNVDYTYAVTIGGQDAGGATLSVTGINDYEGVVTQTFTIGKATQAALVIDGLAGTSQLSPNPANPTSFDVTLSGGSGTGDWDLTSSDLSIASVSAKNATSYTVTVLKKGDYTLTATRDGDGNHEPATLTSSTQHVVDVTAPQVTVSTGTHQWNEFWNTLTFGIFAKETQTVTISARDNNDSASQLTYEYHVSDKELTLTEAQQIAGWATGSTVGLDPNIKAFVYARVTDASGNASIVNTNGIVVYTDSTAITEQVTATWGNTDSKSIEVLLNGNTINTVSRDGHDLDPATDYTTSGGTITLDGTYLASLERAEHEFTVTYNPQGESYNGATGNTAPATTHFTLDIIKADQTSLGLTGLNANYTYGDPDFTISATGGSGTGALTYTSSDPQVATIDSATGLVHIVGSGTFTITASKTGDQHYNSANTTSDTITVAKRAVTVTADSASIEYGESMPKLTFTIEPHTIEGDVLSGELRAVNAKVIPDVGKYAIDEQLPFAHEHYDVTFVAGTLTVTPNEQMNDVMEAIDHLPEHIRTVEDADLVAETSRAYEALNDSERAQLDSVYAQQLALFQSRAASVNAASGQWQVTADDLPWNVRLMVEDMPRSSSAYDAFSGCAKGVEVHRVLDIYLYDTLTGKRYAPPSGTVFTIELHDSELSAVEDLRVLHRLEDGSIERLVHEIRNRSIVFETGSFSPFALVSVKQTEAESENRRDLDGNATRTESAGMNELASTGSTILTVLLCMTVLIACAYGLRGFVRYAKA